MSCGLYDVNGPVQGAQGRAFHAVKAQAKAMAQGAFNAADANWAQTKAAAQADLANLVMPTCPDYCVSGATGQGIDEVREVREPRRRRGAPGFECAWASTASAYKWIECNEKEDEGVDASYEQQTPEKI